MPTLTAPPIADVLARPDAELLRRVPYTRGQNCFDALTDLQSRHRWLYNRLDHTRLTPAVLAEYLIGLGDVPDHFGTDGASGRGDAYRAAQTRNPLARRRGVAALFDLFETRDRPVDPDFVLVDAIGGNGTLTRAVRRIRSAECVPTVITADLSPEMVRDALGQGLPAVRQTAARFVLADRSVSGVLFAYGTHHIPPADRPTALAEAYRVLSPGGIVVVQDFEADSVTARFYSELLHRHTLTGHDCQHFSRPGMTRLLSEAGFTDVRVVELYDPFEIEAPTAEQARAELLEHVQSLFGLRKLDRRPNETRAAYLDRLEQTIAPFARFERASLPALNPLTGELAVYPIVGGYRAELPRVALVGVGRRSAGGRP